MNAESLAPKPFQFPMDLTAGEPRNQVVSSLQQRKINQGDFDRDFTVWSIPGRYSYKSFEPSSMTLAYRNYKLMQVTLVQPEMTECADVISMMEDAVAFIQSHYTFPAENISKGPHFGTNNCVLYMKPGLSGWQAWDNDYAVNIDANWRDMKYTGFVTFTYLPLFNTPDNHQPDTLSAPPPSTTSTTVPPPPPGAMPSILPGH